MIIIFYAIVVFFNLKFINMIDNQVLKKKFYLILALNILIVCILIYAYNYNFYINNIVDTIF